MAASIVFGPALPHHSSRLSTSSSPESLEGSSESPSTATSTRFSFSIRYVDDRSSQDDVVPKVEEVEEDELVDAKIPLNEGEEKGESSASQAVMKRPRGRPRKYPKTPPASLSKAPKGRSKTGCITCRRRKKKCDETKPE
ncbi:hypothetical protein LTS18_003909, partial [Coniosporium uncinatum]